MPTNRIPVYLLACCDQALKSSVERADSSVSSKLEVDVLAAIKRKAVFSEAVSVFRTDLLAMKQDNEENIIAFGSPALGKARNYKLVVNCPYNTDGDCSEDIVRQVILAGMYDNEIKRNIVSATEIDDKLLNDTIALIETEEMASCLLN